MGTKNNTEENIKSLTRDARTLLAATSDMADEKITEARKRLESALDNGKQIYEDLRDKATCGMKAADGFLHDNPYKGVGIAMLLGALIILAFRRRN